MARLRSQLLCASFPPLIGWHAQHPILRRPTPAAKTWRSGCIHPAPPADRRASCTCSTTAIYPPFVRPPSPQAYTKRCLLLGAADLFCLLLRQFDHVSVCRGSIQRAACRSAGGGTVSGGPPQWCATARCWQSTASTGLRRSKPSLSSTLGRPDLKRPRCSSRTT